MISVDAYEIARLVGDAGPRRSDAVEYATIVEPGEGGALRGVPDGCTQSVPLIRCCHAVPGDRVVVLKAGREWLAVAVVGGDSWDARIASAGGLLPSDWIIDSGKVSGWSYEKWAGGKLVQRKRYEVSVTSWNSWGAVYEGIPGVSGEVYGLTFAGEAPSWRCETVLGESGYGALGFSFNGGSITRAPNVWIVRPDDPGALVYTFELIATGRWK